jgi:hypothetical protein
MKAVFVLISIFTLTGCAEWGAVKSSIATHGARIADEELVTARWLTCEAATVGAVRRKYSGDPEGLAAWQGFCRLKAEAAAVP